MKSSINKKKKQSPNNTIVNANTKNHRIELDEQRETKEFCSIGNKERLEIGHRFVEHCQSLLTDNESNQKILRVLAWFKKQGLTSHWLYWWLDHDPEFKKLYDEGMAYFAELNMVGVQTHYLEKSSTMWHLPMYSEKYRKLAEFHKNKDSAQYTQEQIYQAGLALLGIDGNKISPQRVPTTSD